MGLGDGMFEERERERKRLTFGIGSARACPSRAATVMMMEEMVNFILSVLLGSCVFSKR